LTNDRATRSSRKPKSTPEKAQKPTENTCQQDAAEFLGKLISFLHNDIKKGFVFVIPTRVIGDIKIQIAEASKTHWAMTLMEEQYSVIQEMFLYQVVLIKKCLECNKETYTFEVNTSICIKYDPTMKNKSLSIMELLRMTFGNTISNIHYCIYNEL